MSRNQTITITYTAFDTATNVPRPNDVAQHTLYVVADGVKTTALNTPVDISGGEYSLVLRSSENTGEVMAVLGVSSTPGVVIVPTRWTQSTTSVGQPGTVGTLVSQSPTSTQTLNLSTVRLITTVQPGLTLPIEAKTVITLTGLNGGSVIRVTEKELSSPPLTTTAFEKAMDGQTTMSFVLSHVVKAGGPAVEIYIEDTADLSTTAVVTSDVYTVADSSTIIAQSATLTQTALSLTTPKKIATAVSQSRVPIETKTVVTVSGLNPAGTIQVTEKELSSPTLTTVSFTKDMDGQTTLSFELSRVMRENAPNVEFYIEDLTDLSTSVKVVTDVYIVTSASSVLILDATTQLMQNCYKVDLMQLTVGETRVPGAVLVVTTQANGDGVVLRTAVDSAGESVVFLKAGTYYRWGQHRTFSFVNPQIFAVTAPTP